MDCPHQASLGIYGQCIDMFTVIKIINQAKHWLTHCLCCPTVVEPRPTNWKYSCYSQTLPSRASVSQLRIPSLSCFCRGVTVLSLPHTSPPPASLFSPPPLPIPPSSPPTRDFSVINKRFQFDSFNNLWIIYSAGGLLSGPVCLTPPGFRALPSSN